MVQYILHVMLPHGYANDWKVNIINISKKKKNLLEIKHTGIL